MGSVFGTSNLVWASIIGLILIYLAAGYYLGGRWADRSPYFKTMYMILAWGAFTSGLVPLVARPVLRFAAGAFDQLQVGILFGSFTAVLILFSLPVTLLGMTSPLPSAWLSRTCQAGAISGRIYAISTSALHRHLPAGAGADPFDRYDAHFHRFQRFPASGGAGWPVAQLRLAHDAALGLDAGPARPAGLALPWGPIKSTEGQIFETEFCL